MSSHAGDVSRVGESGSQAVCDLDRSERLSIVVPCFNESATVAELLQRVRRSLPAAQIIVIDDGSTDHSFDRIRSAERSLELEVLQLDQNRGKGAAFREGLKLADREFVIIQDADLEYEPSDIVTILDLAIANNSDSVYGSRYLTNGRRQGGAWRNYLAVLLLSRLLRLRHGLRLTDPATGYKLFRRDLLESVKLTSDGFELCQELNRFAAERKWRVDEVAVSYEPRTVREGKKIRAADFWSAVNALLRVTRACFAFMVLAFTILGCGSNSVPIRTEGISGGNETLTSPTTNNLAWDCGLIFPGERTCLYFPLEISGIEKLEDVVRLEASCECLEVKLFEADYSSSGEPKLAIGFVLDRSNEAETSDAPVRLGIRVEVEDHVGEIHILRVDCVLMQSARPVETPGSEI